MQTDAKLSSTTPTQGNTRLYAPKRHERAPSGRLLVLSASNRRIRTHSTSQWGFMKLSIFGSRVESASSGSRLSARCLSVATVILIGCGSSSQEVEDSGASPGGEDGTVSTPAAEAGSAEGSSQAQPDTGSPANNPIDASTSALDATSHPDSGSEDGGATVARDAASARDASADATGSSLPDAAAPGSAFAVLTNRYGNQRLGSNTFETTLNVANVGGGKFGLVFSQPVDGHILAQPLYLPGVVVGGVKHNVVYVATEHDTVYAFDADAPGNALWTTSLGTPMDAVVSTRGWLVVPFSPGATVSCADMFPKSGITSTPVIDPTTGRMYVEAKTLENGNYVHRLHALDVLTGKEVTGSPVVIEGSVPGTGLSSAGGSVAFNPRGLNRPGLLLMNGTVYIAFGSHCDDPPYHGWVFAYAADTLAQKGLFNVTPNGAVGEGAIWQSGNGLAGDAQGNVFFAAGNGDIDPTNKGINLGESVVRLSTASGGLTLGDWWTADNAVTLNSADIDLQAGPLLLPNPPILVAGGKDGNYYSFDPANLGKYNPPSTNSIIQAFSIGGGNHVHAPIYWDGPAGPTLFNWSEGSSLRAFHFNGMMLVTTPVSQYTGASPTHPGGILSLSSNGTVAGTGIVWASLTSAAIDTTGTAGDAWHNLVPGAMFAFDASNLTTPIWTSLQNKARDDIGIFAKYNIPVVANGKVYLGTSGKPDGGKLQVYGLLP
jgi:hypothetical protein